MKNDLNETITKLETQVMELIQMCNQLRQENRILIANDKKWKQERSNYIEKNEKAGTKIKDMIQLLRTME